jgi:hypothetical protein
MSKLKDIEIQYGKASDIALGLIEQRARAILRKKKNLNEFVMGMGVINFTDKNGEIVDHNHQTGYDEYLDQSYYEPFRWAKPVTDILDEWDDYLKLTGTPMRFTADGPIIRQW